jgi:putative transposase
VAQTVKTFQYRLYPTRKQQRALEQALDECRWLYNHFLESRKRSWEERQESLTLYDQLGALSALKRERPTLTKAHSQVLQNVGVRIDLAFQAFFRRARAGETPGYPRFRGRQRYDSFCFPQYGNGCRLDGDQLYLSKIGTVRVVLHRKLEGTPKTVCVRRSATGKWYATIACEWEPARLPEVPDRVGIDVGLASFATLSTGETIPNPRFFRAEEKALARAQRRLAKEAKGTPGRRKRRKVVARVHERTRFRRKDFAHQNSRRIVNRFQVIAVEDLSVNRMVHNHCLAKSISDAAWAEFASMLRVKAEWAGRAFIAVNPAYSSQDCSRCGHRQKMPLSDRIYRCPCCLLELDRDLNAALNLLRLGLQALGLGPLKPTGLPAGVVTPSFRRSDPTASQRQAAQLRLCRRAAAPPPERRQDNGKEAGNFDWRQNVYRR